MFLDSAVWVARAAGVSQIIIGATIVSICTTLPEFVASLTAAFKGSADMAVGNAVGSVICNTGLVLGITLLFVSAHVQREVFLIKGVFMAGGLAALLLFLVPGAGASHGGGLVTAAEGGVLLIFFVIFLVVNYYESLHGAEPLPPVVEESEGPPARSDGAADGGRLRDWLVHLGMFALGAGLLTAGAWLLINYGQRLARNLGMSEAVISLVFIALGTSLPELFTAISAVRKKATDISVGNVFGANVLNVTLVTGSSAVVQPLAVRDPALMRFDIPMAFLLCVIAFGSGLFHGRIGRRTGALLFVIYLLYLGAMATGWREAAL